MAKKKSKAVAVVNPSLVDCAISGAPIFGRDLPFLGSLPNLSPVVGSGISLVPGSGATVNDGSGSVFARSTVAAGPVATVIDGSGCVAAGSGSSPGSGFLTVGTSPSAPQVPIPPLMKVRHPQSSVGAVQFGPLPGDAESPTKNYAALLKSSAQLQELGTPVEHVSGAPFVLIPNENIEAAKLEFKEFIYARFHGDYPSMGKIIGVVNAIWARQGPKIYVHNIGHGIYLLRVTNQRSREALLSRTCWNIGGLPMFVAPWSSDYSPDEPPLTSAIVPVEMRNVPYLLFNQESLSRLATAVGKPDSLALETERKLNFEVAKLFVRVDLTRPLPNKIVSGFSNGKEVVIDVSYPWLPVKCGHCSKFGHNAAKCSMGPPEGDFASRSVRKQISETTRRHSPSRQGRSTAARKVKDGTLRYVPVTRKNHADSVELEPAEGFAVKEQEPLSVRSLPLGYDSELEEGEIYQQVIQVFNATQQSVEDISEVQKTLVETLVDHRGALVEDSAKISDVDAVGVMPISPPEIANAEAMPVPETSDPDGLNSNSDSPAIPPANDELPCHESSGQEGSRSDGSRAPEEEQEQERPFILVNNRRCGRKAAKSH